MKKKNNPRISISCRDEIRLLNASNGGDLKQTDALLHQLLSPGCQSLAITRMSPDVKKNLPQVPQGTSLVNS